MLPLQVYNDVHVWQMKCGRITFKSLASTVNFWCDVTGSKLSNHFCMHAQLAGSRKIPLPDVQLLSHRDGMGYRAVCTDPSDSSAFHLKLHGFLNAHTHL